tara:strand:- start:10059 stop:10523 length:465 start_codon:yes stop_codon:yes gene_type:complete
MIKEVTLQEAMMLEQVVSTLIGKGIPVLKDSILEANKTLKEITTVTLEKKQEIINKYLTRNEDGSGVLKEGIDETKNLLVTDFESSDEEAMIKEINELVESTIKLDFKCADKDSEVLVKVDGEYKTFTLEDYLNKSTAIDTRILGLLNEFFINE